MNRRQKRKLVRNAKMFAVCGAVLYLALGVRELNEMGVVETMSTKSIVYAQQTENQLDYLMDPAPTEADTSEVEELETSYQSVICSYDWDAEDAYMLTKIAMAEAEGEDTKGKALVMLVVLNRSWSCGYPNSLEDVIFQDEQFSPVNSGRYDSVEPNEDCWNALELIESGWDESYGALYFESKSKSTWHEDNLEFLFQHGNHYFYKDKEQRR